MFDAVELHAGVDDRAGHDADGDVASIVAAFDPIYEPELLIEYLRIWAAGARTHASNLFDDVSAIEVESIACLELERLVEHRSERTMRVPSEAALPPVLHDRGPTRASVLAGDELRPERIESRAAGSEQRIACSCIDGAERCATCAGTGRTAGGARGCVACGATGTIAHDACHGSGVLVQYVHATITRELETSCTMSRGSRGMARAADADWLHTSVDASQVLPLLPAEIVVPVTQAWTTDPPGTIARRGTISALPIYRVTFRWGGKERRAWLIGTQLRVVVPGTVGRTSGWMLKRAIGVAMTVVSVLMSLVHWQNQRTEQPASALPQAGVVEPAAPAPSPPVKRVSIPK